MKIISFLSKIMMSWIGSSPEFPINSYYRHKYRYHSRHDYYFMHNILLHPESFSKLLNDIQDPNTRQVNTLTKIAPFNINFPISEHQLMKQKGKPKFVLNNRKNISSHRIVFYKKYLSTYSFFSQFHFIDDNLFLIKQDISYNHIDDRKKIFELLKKKYSLTHLDGSLNQSNLLVVDTFGNRLFIKNSFKLEVFYLAYEPKTFEKLENLLLDYVEFERRSLALIDTKLAKCI